MKLLRENFEDESMWFLLGQPGNAFLLWILYTLLPMPTLRQPIGPENRPPYTSLNGIPMGRRVLSLSLSLFFTAALALSIPKYCLSQQPGISSAERAIELAHSGRCKEALPLLKAATRSADKQLKYDSAMLLARCAMSLNQTETAVDALVFLNREFPHDPEVLYTTTHFYSELASRASQELASRAPDSPQAEKLEAEAFESQGNWDRATEQYNKILQQNPKEPEIHFRLGRILLSRIPPDPAGAKKEFEAELKLNPGNASAEFMLGETARQAGQWDDAITHFSHATNLDAGFAEAYLALGMSLNSAGKFSDAISPLQSYVKMQPEDPAGHYQLATAYSRTGRKTEAERQMALQREASAKNPEQSH
jgi:tetratricopeptide (TPR) repeat protein